MPSSDGVGMMIAGNIVEATEEDWLETLDPASGLPLARVPRGTAADVDRAVLAARSAQPAWAALPPGERGRLICAIADRIESERYELARIESQDTGKPLRQALSDVTAAARYFEFYGGFADKIRGTTIPLGADYVDYTVREPIGVSGQIIPWNYPLQIGARGIAPALAAGNAVVVKPAEDAPLALLRLAGLVLEEGLPHGLLNVVTGFGTEAGAALASHRGVNQVTFTGSVATGVRVAQMAAQHVAPVTLELGGKCPNIVFDDADLDVAVPVLVNAIVQNAGQTCSAASRLIVSATIHDVLVERLSEAMRAVTLGRGTDDPEMGPLISARQRDKVTAFVERAVDAGAALLAGGSPADIEDLEGGFFYPATLLDGVRPGSEVARDEVFGPVLSVLTFSSEAAALEIANGTDYGLVSGIWTANGARALRVASALKCGQVFINGYGAAGGIEIPFGGYAYSGYGREKGIEGLDSYLQTKNVCVRVTDQRQ